MKVIRDPHIGTGISKSIMLDWGKESVAQVKKDNPDAMVVFIGANEGFDDEGPGREDVQCCGIDYAAIYASRVRQMMNTYRQAGAARVYWLTLPSPRDPDRQKIARTVNAAIARGRPAVALTGARVRHRLDLHPGRRLPRLDERGRPAARSSASPTASI